MPSAPTITTTFLRAAADTAMRRSHTQSELEHANALYELAVLATEAEEAGDGEACTAYLTEGMALIAETPDYEQPDADAAEVVEPAAEPEPDPAGDADVEALVQETLPDVVRTAPPVSLLKRQDLSLYPGGEELLALAAMAQMLATSGLVPVALRGKPNDVLLVLITGRDLGVAPTVAMRECYVIEGAVTVSPGLRLAQIRTRGLGRIIPGPNNDKHRAEAFAMDPDGNRLGPPLVYTWEDAQEAGLVDDRCEPEAHVREKKANGKSGCYCKSNWRTYPARMLWWRAAGYAADDYFPEASAGLYSPDELGAITDRDGRVIDVMEAVEVPAGMGAARSAAAAVEYLSPAEAEEIQRRIDAIPRGDVRSELGARWRDRGLPSAADLSVPEAKLARALIDAAEKALGTAATATSADPELSAPVAPVAAPESDRETPLLDVEQDPA